MPRYNEFKTEATKEMGYLLGATLSDGSIWCVKTKRYEHRPQFRLQFEQVDREMVEEILRCIEVITGRCYPIRPFINKAPAKPSYRAIIYGNEFLSWMFEVTKQKTRVPDFWPVTSEEFRKALIAGLLDGDGCISERLSKAGTPQWMIGAYSSDPWLDDFAEVCHSLGIGTHPKGLNRAIEGQKKVYGLRVKHKEFATKGINFVIRRKQERLERLRAYMESSEAIRQVPHVG